MVLSKTVAVTDILHLTSTQKRRIRRKRLREASTTPGPADFNAVKQQCSRDIYNNILVNNNNPTNTIKLYFERNNLVELDSTSLSTEMSAKEPSKSREDILAARAAKKSDKHKTKIRPSEVKNIVQQDIINKHDTQESKSSSQSEEKNLVYEKPSSSPQSVKSKLEPNITAESLSNVGVKDTSSAKSKDEVDRANIQLVTAEIGSGEKSKDQIIAERAAKKAAKQAKKKGLSEAIDTVTVTAVKEESSIRDVNEDLTVKEVVKTLKDIVEVAREMKEVTAKVEAINLESKKKENTNKSKAELKAERRAKQEAQRAAKQSTLQEKVATKPPHTSSTSEPSVKPAKDVSLDKEKSPKPKSVEKAKLKPSSGPVNWFQHLNIENDKDMLNKIPLNSNLHPAIVKLGVQLATRVVSGSNARCIALLDALKKMVTDYTLPAKTEFARGLESHLATSLDFLWSMRQPSASQTNAVKYFRHHLTQLPNNVDEFDAKKKLQEEIDRYIREQIDMAGEAISMTVRKKITAGDFILTYECSSLIERILREAWSAGSQFRVCVCGRREGRGGREMLRRLAATGLPCTYIDVTGLSAVMKKVSKVLLGASSLLVNGSVLGTVGTAQVALVARELNVPVLVACETHKFSERVQTDAFVYNELGDPDDLIDKSDENSPLRDWRSNPNLTLLNLTYDVTPPSLVTAVVTELAILPCTSAPVVLRFKLSEYGV